MLHERISDGKIAAAAWPASLESLILLEATDPPGDRAEAEPEKAGFTPAAPDVAAGVGRLIVAAYAGLIAVFFVFFTGSLLATMMVTVAAGFVAIFFAVPRIFFALEPGDSRRPSLSDFMYRGIDTLTGHSSGGAALVQMLIGPVLLTFGLLIMGIVGAIYL